MSYPGFSPILVTNKKGKHGDFANQEKLNWFAGAIGRNSSEYRPMDKRFERAVCTSWRNLTVSSWRNLTTCQCNRASFGFRGGSNSTSGRAVQAKNPTSKIFTKEKRRFYFAQLFGLWAETKRKMKWWFLVVFEFVAWFLPDFIVGFRIFCTVISSKQWSAKSRVKDMFDGKLRAIINFSICGRFATCNHPRCDLPPITTKFALSSTISQSSSKRGSKHLPDLPICR